MLVRTSPCLMSQRKPTHAHELHTFPGTTVAQADSSRTASASPSQWLQKFFHALSSLGWRCGELGPAPLLRIMPPVELSVNSVPSQLFNFLPRPRLPAASSLSSIGQTQLGSGFSWPFFLKRICVVFSKRDFIAHYFQAENKLSKVALTCPIHRCLHLHNLPHLVMAWTLIERRNTAYFRRPRSTYSRFYPERTLDGLRTNSESIREVPRA